ncbi:hypothetical protein GH714_027681 [Hevea brasiliensis]|uniref:Uncharacterized protein n=1 Tax=Hevea brasiliensis TaxID=3981 RepID=A0A6A6MQ76_HEVBR|nr:hypothetical protein GH714_027681 [Hevea brasiliensis]
MKERQRWRAVEDAFLRAYVKQELEEEHRAWAASTKEAAWRLRRVELQLESKKPSQRKEKMEEIESKIKALGEEQRFLLTELKQNTRNN